MTKNTLMALVLVAIAGCGDGGDTLSQQDAQQALTAVAGASVSGITAVDAQVEGSSGQVTVNATASCQGSGTVRAQGTVTVNSTNNTFTYNLNLSFTDCRVVNTTINGTLSYTGNGSAQSLSTSLTGQVTVSGAVSGTCSIDVNQSFNATTSSYSLSGRACGRSLSIQYSGQ